MLDGGALSGRRALTLVPDHHICVVSAEQIHGQIAEALAAVAAAVTEQHAPITLVSGPSATSDIELERVEGVHGPRHLTVLIVRMSPGSGARTASSGAAAASRRMPVSSSASVGVAENVIRRCGAGASAG